MRYCVSVLAAADRCAAEDTGLLRTLDAMDATRLLVSLEDMLTPLLDVAVETNFSSRARRGVIKKLPTATIRDRVNHGLNLGRLVIDCKPRTSLAVTS